jgi:hypothetical protein
MSETGSETPAQKPRGEAGWKAHKERIAARNDEARKAGKQQRREGEQRAEAVRQAQERRVEASLQEAFDARFR